MNPEEERDRALAMLALVLVKLGEPVKVTEEDRANGIPTEAEITVTPVEGEDSILIGLSTYE